MAFSVSRVEVQDSESATPYVRKDITDPSEIKDLINMNRSYKKNPNTNRDVLAAYEYHIRLVRDDYELTAECTKPSDIDVLASTMEMDVCIWAKLSYKKDSGVLQINRLSVTYNVDIYEELPSNAEIAEKLARVVAMFRIIREIAPLAVGGKAQPTYKVGFQSAYFPPENGMTRKEKADKSVAYKAAVAKQLAAFNIVAKL
jgi:hypothetical protein